ncbi:tetratricopeptide repeat-containing sensor histidine kinase [Marinoscillum pacificum]|uniref:tetratricopeptide repeat-containing sensor histidine kinase n=1 Tax=Marinoscillum pacificum TaxID=392723 RepID=UPI0021584627|nr:tetratricopeptide repeat protein [Marinoscillum pacificum]
MKFHYTCLFILHFIPIISYGQSASEIDSLNSQSSNLLFIQTDSAQRLAQKALELAKTIDDTLRMANANHNLGLTFHVQGMFEEASSHYQRAIELRRGTKDEDKIAGLMNNLASIQVALGDYTRALALYQESLSLKLAAGDKAGAANTLNNIGIIHYENQNFEEALSYYQQGLALRQELNITERIAASLGNIGLAYYDMGLYEEALDYYMKGYLLVKESDEVCSMVYLANGLGFAYYGLDSLNKSKYYSQLAYDAAKECNDPTVIATAVNNLGKINFKQGRKTLAEKQYLEAYNVAQTNQLYSELKELCFSLYEYYKQSSEPDKALHYYEKFVNVRDSLESKEVTKKITTLELNYEFEKKKDSLSFAQQRELMVYSAESNRQKVIKNYTLIILAMTLIIIIILFINYSNKQKSNKELSSKNNIISSALREKELLIREIHHRVKNNLQVISSMLNIQHKTVQDTSTKIALQETQNRVLAMSMVHNSLYNGEQINLIESDQYVHELLDILEDAIVDDRIEIIRKIDSFTIKSDLAINLGLLINEIFTNAVKHAFTSEISNPQICITLNKQSNYFVLDIADNGIGSSNQSNTSKISFGTNLIESVVQTIRAEMIQSAEGGTTIRITVPLDA